MRLTVTRSGGISGLTRQWSLNLPQTDCTRWEAALERIPRCDDAPPDGRAYDIALGDTHAVIAEKDARHGALAELLRQLQHDIPGNYTSHRT